MSEQDIQAALWEVVQELAEETTTYWDDPSGERVCLFCNSTPSRDYLREGVRHEENCLVMRARRLVKTKKIQCSEED